tara:strand:- start:11063 stop:12079 length:1017 start_codon:yes stop_codon:yes gene_type:complete
MAKNYRDATREGTAAAARFHVRMKSQQNISELGGHIDVFSYILEELTELLFRPLQGLLGAYMPDSRRPGILITTQRPLSIQRFTAAHELGHFLLKHEPSFDGEEMLRRGVIPASSSSANLQEVSADAFAVAFMMPRWLIEWHCDRHGWWGDGLTHPANIYQLSLRIGASYQATCWTLERYRMISSSLRRALLGASPKSVKEELLGSHIPESYRGNVWLITEADAGTRIDGSRNDHFVLRLKEHSSGGYLWNFDAFEKSGFAILEDKRDSIDHSGIGGLVSRRILASSGNAAHGYVSLTEARPWQPHVPRAQIVLDYDVTGPESEGLSRIERRRLLAAA